MNLLNPKISDNTHLSIFGYTILLACLSYFIGFEVLSDFLGYSKWILLISLLAIFAVIKYRNNKIGHFPATLLTIFYGAIFIIKNSIVLSQNIYIFVPIIVLINWFIYRARKDLPIINKSNYYFDFLIYNLFFTVSFISVGLLSNWATLVSLLPRYKFIGIPLVFAFFAIISVYVFNAFEAKRQITTTKKSQRIIYIGCAFIIFSWISFRHDSLFELSISGSPLYHWEYFVGVINNIRSGGVLLWSTPSQYGFLNILFASLIPIDSGWHSFYIFQSTLLLIVAMMTYLTLEKLSNTSAINYIFNFFLVFLALFFADSTFIGPYPFPSSSVVRFFGVYTLLFCIYNIPKSSKKQLLYLCLIFPVSVLWSAESALYSASIILFVLISLWLTNNIALFKAYITALSVSLLIPFIAIVTFYKIKWGHYPDVYSFFEYVIGYAQGFGYVQFPGLGPGNLLLLLFASILYQYKSYAFSQNINEDNSLTTPLIVSAGCIWGISSYYIGRPVAQNITALIPLIALASYFAIAKVSKASLKSNLLPLKLSILPLLFVVFIPLVNIDFYRQLLSVQSFSTNIDVKKKLSKSDLYIALEEAKLSDFSVIFYGDDNQSTSPVLPNGLQIKVQPTWLPTPLQLIEVPLKNDRRLKYLSRYICAIKVNDGAIVLPVSEQLLKRFNVINESIKSYYDLTSDQTINGYAIYKYRLKNEIHCSKE
jgi:hypothetical protein